MAKILILIIFLIIVICFYCFQKSDYQAYIIGREKIISDEEATSIGSRIILTNSEQIANDILMKWKQKELSSDTYLSKYSISLLKNNKNHFMI